MWVVVAVSDQTEDVVVVGAYKTEGGALTVEEDLQAMGYEAKTVRMMHGLGDVPALETHCKICGSRRVNGGCSNSSGHDTWPVPKLWSVQERSDV